MKDSTNIFIIISAACLVGVVGFFAGMHVTQRRMNTQIGNFRPMMSGNRGGNMMGGRGVVGMKRGGIMGRGQGGSITKISGNVVTLTSPDGTTHDVTLSDTTVVDTIVKGTVKDLKVGQTIMMAGGGFWSGAQTIIVKP